jgi:hypothetical protein
VVEELGRLKADSEKVADEELLQALEQLRAYA